MKKLYIYQIHFNLTCFFIFTGNYCLEGFIDFIAASAGDENELVKILSVLIATCSLQVCNLVVFFVQLGKLYENYCYKINDVFVVITSCFFVSRIMESCSEKILLLFSVPQCRSKSRDTYN